ncbi:dienelactone hydrolase family protein [Smaragdicoccus niigatensis]
MVVVNQSWANDSQRPTLGNMPGFYEDEAPLRDAAGSVPLTAIEPDRPPRGGIILLHEANTLPAGLLEVMALLAGEGWIVVSPNLFHRGKTDGEVFGADLFADFDACHDWLVGRGVFEDTVGVLGFNDAGVAALVVATNRPLGAAISIAARGILTPVAEDAPTLVDAAANIRVPWLGLYATDDPDIPAEHLSLLREAAGRSGVASNVVASADALIESQNRILDWFDSYLR